jgi:hypothetical protein
MSGAKAAGGGSDGSRWSERSERPPVRRNALGFPTPAGVADSIHAAWYLVRDSCRSRKNPRRHFPAVSRFARDRRLPYVTPSGVVLSPTCRVSGAKAAGGGSNGSRWSERSERPPVRRNAPNSLTPAGVADSTHAACYLVRDSCRSRENPRCHFPAVSRFARATAGYRT